MTRERLIWLLTALALAAGTWWLTLNTEWVDDTRPRPAQGAARDNPVYALEQMLRRLGMEVSHHEALNTLPPPQARLIMLSSDWKLMRERAGQLQQWVQRGGHLVLVQGTDWEAPELAAWMPIEEVEVKPGERIKPPPRPVPWMARAAASTESRSTLVSTPPLLDGVETVDTCSAFYSTLKLRAKPGHEARWTLARVDGTTATQAVIALQNQALQNQGAQRDKPARPATPPATQALRVAVGQGSVTVLNAGDHVFVGTGVLDCDNPLMLAATLQAEPGATAWIYLQEKREALLPWLWHQGWIAIVAGLLALAGALWRAAVRFGPREAAAPRLRRSISEQVRGLAAYLQGNGREALLAAQQRALDEAALRSLPRYARLPAAERVRSLAAATGLATDELAGALSAKFCTRAELLKYLPLLETARRRLHKSSDERRPP